LDFFDTGIFEFSSFRIPRSEREIERVAKDERSTTSHLPATKNFQHQYMLPNIHPKSL
jgi:hypothetical protein